MASVHGDQQKSVHAHRTVWANGYRYHFHYHLIGPDDLPVLFFLHGFMGNCHAFDRVLPYFGDRFRCLIVDLPGHGQTKVYSGEGGYIMESTAIALIELLRQLQINRCRLLGYSMGGRLALYLALHFPDYFDHVILESASPGLKTQSEQDQRLQHDLQLARKLETTNFEAFLKQWYNQPLFASLCHHPDFEHLLEQRRTNHPLPLARSLRQLSTGHQPSLWPQLTALRNPLLLLIGELDLKFVQINTEIQMTCKIATLKVVAQCGHNIHFEQPLVFANAIREFVGLLTLE